MSRKRDRETYSENLDSPKEVETPPEMASEPLLTPEVSEPIAAVASPTPTEDPSSAMTLRVYATIAGPRWDQMAGFVAWATQRKLGPLTMSQWNAEHEKFKNRPVG